MSLFVWLVGFSFRSVPAGTGLVRYDPAYLGSVYKNGITD